MKQKLALEDAEPSTGKSWQKRSSRCGASKSELAAQQALLKSHDATDVTDADLEMALQNDPVARQLFVELGWRKLDQVYMEGAVVSGAERTTPTALNKT